MINLENSNMATVSGLGLGAVTAGGALFVGTVVAPAQVLGGAAFATALVIAGSNKAENGGYFAFGKGDKAEAKTPATTEAAPAAA